MTSPASAAIQYVDDDFLLQQRRVLSSRRASYREQVDRFSVAEDELAQAGEAPDIGDEQGFSEADSLNVERDRVRSLTALARVRIDEVDAALGRLKAGTYGACRSCRRPIPKARLDAVPEATRCVKCASGSVLGRR